MIMTNAHKTTTSCRTIFFIFFLLFTFVLGGTSTNVVAHLDQFSHSRLDQKIISKRIDGIYVRLFGEEGDGSNFDGTAHEGNDAREKDKLVVNMMVLAMMAEGELSKILTEIEGKVAGRDLMEKSGIFAKLIQFIGKYGKMGMEMFKGEGREQQPSEVDLCHIWKYLEAFRNIKLALKQKRWANLEAQMESGNKCEDLAFAKLHQLIWYRRLQWDIVFGHFFHLNAALLRDPREKKSGKTAKIGRRLLSKLMAKGAGDGAEKCVHCEQIFERRPKSSIPHFGDAQLVELYKELFATEYGRTRKPVQAEIRLNIHFLYNTIWPNMDTYCVGKKERETVILRAQLQLLANLAMPILKTFLRQPTEEEEDGTRDGKQIVSELHEFLQLLDAKCSSTTLAPSSSSSSFSHPLLQNYGRFLGANLAEKWQEAHKSLLPDHFAKLTHFYRTNEGKLKEYIGETRGAKSRLAKWFGGLEVVKKEFSKLKLLLMPSEQQIIARLKWGYATLAKCTDIMHAEIAKALYGTHILALLHSLEMHLMNEQKKSGATIKVNLVEWYEVKLRFTLFVDSLEDCTRSVDWIELNGLAEQNVIYALWKQCMVPDADGGVKKCKFDGNTVTEMEAEAEKWTKEGDMMDGDAHSETLTKLHLELSQSMMANDAAYREISRKAFLTDPKDKVHGKCADEKIMANNEEEEENKAVDDESSPLHFMECPAVEPEEASSSAGHLAAGGTLVATKSGDAHSPPAFGNFIEQLYLEYLRKPEEDHSLPDNNFILHAFLHHYLAFLRMFYVENFHKMPSRIRKSLAFKVLIFFCHGVKEGDKIDAAGGGNFDAVQLNAYGFEAKFVLRFVEFMEQCRQNIGHLLAADNKQKEKEKEVPLWRNLCRVHKFLVRWLADNVLLANEKWRMHILLNLGLPIKDNYRGGQSSSPTEGMVEECANGEQTMRMIFASSSTRRPIDLERQVHLTNLEMLIRVSPKLTAFLCQNEHKKKLLQLLGHFLPVLEEQHPEVLKIWKIEPTFRWLFYEEILGMDPPIASEQPDDMDSEDGDSAKCAAQWERRVNTEMRTMVALLTGKLIESVDQLLLNQRHQNYDDNKKGLKRAIKRIKGEIYMPLRNQNPFTKSYNGAVCLLAHFVDYFKTEQEKQQQQDGRENIANRLTKMLRFFVVRCEQEVIEHYVTIGRQLLREDHKTYLEEKVRADPMMVDKFKRTLGLRTRLSQMLANDPKFDQFADQLGLIDCDIFKEKDVLAVHYLAALFGTNEKARLANRLAADLIVWFRWMDEQIYLKIGEWKVPQNRMATAQFWAKAERKQFIIHKYDSIFLNNLRQLRALMAHFRGWFEGMKWLIENEQRMNRAQYMDRIMKLKKEEAAKDRSKKKVQNLVEINPSKVWTIIEEGGGKGGGVSQEELNKFEKWMQWQHLNGIREMMVGTDSDHPPKNALFRDGVFKNVNEMDEEEWENKMAHFFDRIDNYSDLIELFKEEKGRDNANSATSSSSQSAPIIEQIDDNDWDKDWTKKEVKEKKKKKKKKKKSGNKRKTTLEQLEKGAQQGEHHSAEETQKYGQGKEESNDEVEIAADEPPAEGENAEKRQQELVTGSETIHQKEQQESGQKLVKRKEEMGGMDGSELAGKGGGRDEKDGSELIEKGEGRGREVERKEQIGEERGKEEARGEAKRKEPGWKGGVEVEVGGKGEGRDEGGQKREERDGHGRTIERKEGSAASSSNIAAALTNQNDDKENQKDIKGEVEKDKREFADSKGGEEGREEGKKQAEGGGAEKGGREGSASGSTVITASLSHQKGHQMEEMNKNIDKGEEEREKGSKIQEGKEERGTRKMGEEIVEKGDQKWEKQEKSEKLVNETGEKGKLGVGQRGEDGSEEEEGARISAFSLATSNVQGHFEKRHRAEVEANSKKIVSSVPMEFHTLIAAENRHEKQQHLRLIKTNPHSTTKQIWKPKTESNESSESMEEAGSKKSSHNSEENIIRQNRPNPANTTSHSLVQKQKSIMQQHKGEKNEEGSKKFSPISIKQIWKPKAIDNNSLQMQKSSQNVLSLEKEDARKRYSPTVADNRPNPLGSSTPSHGQRQQNMMLIQHRGKDEEKKPVDDRHPQWKFAQFLDDHFLMAAYKIFIENPRKSVRIELLDIGAMVNEIERRTRAMIGLREEKGHIFETMFPKNPLIHSHQMDNMAIEGGLAKWEAMKRGKWLEMVVEDGAAILDLGKLQWDLYILLREIVDGFEGQMFDGAKMVAAANGSSKLAQWMVMSAQRQLHLTKLPWVFERFWPEISWKRMDGKRQWEILVGLFRISGREVPTFNQQLQWHMANWEEVNRQIHLDNELVKQFVMSAEANDYVSPRHFQPIIFDGMAPSPFTSSSILAIILDAHLQRPEIAEMAKRALKRVLDEWAKEEGIAYKLLLTGSIQFGIHMVDADLDTIVVVTPDERRQILCQPGVEESGKGQNASTSSSQQIRRQSRFEQFFGNENALCLMPFAQHCNDGSLFCRLCRAGGHFTNLQKINGPWVRVPLIELKMRLGNGHANADADIDIAFVCASVDNLEKQSPNEPAWISSTLMQFDRKTMPHSLASYKSNLHLLGLFPPTTNGPAAKVQRANNFRRLIVAMKIWTKNSSLYGGQYGLFNGASLTVISAKICLLYPTASLATLLQRLFLTILTWRWPTPLRIASFGPNDALNRRPLGWSKESEYDSRYGQLRGAKELFGNKAERDRLLGHAMLSMPILTPGYPEQNAAFTVNASTKQIILDVMLDGLKKLMAVASSNGLQWEIWLNGIKSVERYHHFIAISCIGKDHLIRDHFCNYIHNRLRLQLLFTIEANTNISYAHVVKIRAVDKCHEKLAHKRSKYGDNFSCKFWLIGLKVWSPKNGRKEMDKMFLKNNANLDEIYEEELKWELQLAIEIFKNKIKAYYTAAIIIEKRGATGVAAAHDARGRIAYDLEGFYVAKEELAAGKYWNFLMQ